MPQSLWGAVRRTIPMGLIYGAGFQPLMILVNLPPGALPQSSRRGALAAPPLSEPYKWISQHTALQQFSEPTVRRNGSRLCTRRTDGHPTQARASLNRSQL